MNEGSSYNFFCRWRLARYPRTCAWMMDAAWMGRENTVTNPQKITLVLTFCTISSET